MNEKIVIAGAGHMGTAIVLGLLKSDHFQVHVMDPDERRLVELRARGLSCSTSMPPLDLADAVVLAMPPQAFHAFAASSQGLHRHHGPVISVMAGVQVGTIARLLNVTEIVRSIPNTPSEVFSGMTVFFAAAGASDRTLARAVQIFDSFGQSVRVLDESIIDPSTALCGGGPAFVAFFADALQRFGMDAGLDEAGAIAVTLQLLRGTANLMETTGKSALQICQEVMTPNGTTERGIRHLERSGMKPILLEALGKAAARSLELGRTLESKLEGVAS